MRVNLELVSGVGLHSDDGDFSGAKPLAHWLKDDGGGDAAVAHYGVPHLEAVAATGAIVLGGVPSQCDAAHRILNRPNSCSHVSKNTSPLEQTYFSPKSFHVIMEKHYAEMEATVC